VLSKRAKRLTVIALLVLFFMGGKLVAEYIQSAPVGNEVIQNFKGGPNIKEVTGKLTEKEELLYQEVKNNKAIKKMYFLDITADGENELLTLAETTYQRAVAYSITFWGIDNNGEVVPLTRRVVAYNVEGSRFAIYLHPEEDGSYSIMEDHSYIRIDSSVERSNREAKVHYKQYQYELTEEGFKQNIITAEEGKATEKKEAFERLLTLRSESILLYDTLPEEILMSINEEEQDSEEKLQGETITNLVRIYDVIPQGWEYTADSTQTEVNQLQESVWSSEKTMKEKAQEKLNAMEDVEFERHQMRWGPFRGIGNPIEPERTIPYANQLDSIERACGYEIEYVVLDNWEELKEELEKTQGDGITKLVIFNNTFDGSLIKELQSDRYAELSEALEDYDFYNGEKYEQEVLYAGIVNGRQVAVPLLYNVSGMIQGESLQMNSNAEILYEPNPIEGESVDYQAFMENLMQQMQKEEKSNKVDFISAALEESIQPELFLTAAGEEWEDYENQRELFGMLMDYYQTYQDTQLDDSGLSLQYRWGYYWNQAENMDDIHKVIPDEMLLDLKLDSLDAEWYGETIAYGKLGHALLDSCTYIVESSTAEKIAYHSMAGLLDVEGYYLNGNWINGGGAMGYWPVSMLQEKDHYAAQPNNYVAVIAEDGSLDQAAKVIEAMLSQDTDIYHGFALNNEVREKQLQAWESSVRSANAGIRSVFYNPSEDRYREEITLQFWGTVDQGIGLDISTKVPYAQQLREQLDHVGFAQIADREVLTIWQDTVAETVDSNLSAEAGFKLLCERMDAFYE